MSIISAGSPQLRISTGAAFLPGARIRLHCERLPSRRQISLLPAKFTSLALAGRKQAGVTVYARQTRNFFRSQTAVSVARMDSTYTFPFDGTWQLKDDSKTPLVLISCGSFSPITFLHLRMFEMCRDWAAENTEFEVVAGYLSPVSDAYKKEGLAKAYHRVEMCRLSADETFVMVDDWEASKPDYTRTALVLDHFEHEINKVRGGIPTVSGSKRQAKISLLSGADLIQTMSNPGVWAEEDLEHILGRYGAFIIERHGTDMDKALASLQRWRHQIWCIPQLIQNDVSSTKIRNFLREEKSIRSVT